MYLSSRFFLFFFFFFFFSVAAVAVGAGEAAGRALHNLRVDAQIFLTRRTVGLLDF